MAEDSLIIYRAEKSQAWIILNRPEVLNALNEDLLRQLSSFFEKAKSDGAVKAVILTGSGDRAFSAGADIKYMNGASPLEIREFALSAIAVNNRIETLGKPVIAAINGFALGGGLELAEACTLRVAVRHARMGHPEVCIGTVAGWGGTTRLPRLIGKGRAAELLLTGKTVTAEEAFEIGLVNRVVDEGRLIAAAEDLAGEIIEQAPLAVKLTWEAMHRGLNMTLEESTALGADCFGLAATTEDFREGTDAFLKKRKPLYRGR